MTQAGAIQATQNDSITLPPAVQRAGEITAFLAMGALGGYLVYWITRLVAKLGAFTEAEKALITPLPFILSGLMSAAIVETAKLVHDGAMAILGEKSRYAGSEASEDDALLDKFRRHSWKVVTKAEKLGDDVDVIFSNFCNIRTVKDTRHLEDWQLHASSRSRWTRLLEVSRREFWLQVEETLLRSVPQELGIYGVEALGYTLVGGHLLVWIHAVSFILGLAQKVQNVYENAEKEIEEREKIAVAENKAVCDILSAMYPQTSANLYGVEEFADDAQLACDDLDKVQSEDFDAYVDSADRSYTFVVKPDSDPNIDEDESEKELDDIPTNLALCEIETV